MTDQDWVVVVSEERKRLAEFEASFDRRSAWRRHPFSGPTAIYTRSECARLAAPGTPDAAILGHAFAHIGCGAQPSKLSDPTWHELRHGSLDRFLASCWGGFIAVALRDGCIVIVRDPSAAMPCYYAKMADHVLIGPSVAVLIEAGLKKPPVDMGLLAQSLYQADLPSQSTAIAGVHELLPGDCLSIDGDRLRVSRVWSPWDYTAIDEALTFDDHAERLRHAVSHCVEAWGSTARRALVGVSGGLDSSIVATCLATNAAHPICLTVSTDDADGDERMQARQICDYLRLSLLEARYELADIQIELAARSALPRPTGRLIAQGYNAAVQRIAHDTGAETFFTGNGGDNVFAFSQSAGAIADRLLHEGPWRNTWRTAQDICTLTGCSLMQAWRSALRIATGPRRYVWKPDRGFLHPDVVQMLDCAPLQHAWLDAPSKALPGKAAHIAALLRIQRHLDGTGQLRQIRVINPLMSQPVIEACLAIPSWMWCHGGNNRSVARQAFRQAMPAAITDRRSKGGPSGFGARIVNHFRGHIVERLLDGRLAANGIVDRVALERRLCDQRPNWALDQVRVLELLEAEAWIDHWR